MAGVYIHIPFCKQLCSYCDFYFSVSLRRKDDMLKALLYEMSLRKNEVVLLTDSNIECSPTLYFGGGTPTVYSPDELRSLSDMAFSVFLPNGVEEFTVEANPDDLTRDYLKALKVIGVNRLSIGIQSFIDRDLQWMKRRHSAQQAITAVKTAQDVGIENISIDLIYGIPAMSIEEWGYNIDQALGLNVPHLSAYHLTIEPKTILGRKLQQGLLHPIDDELSDIQYKLLEKLTSNAGYLHYEISNFSHESYISKHNSSYWQQQPYIGIGPSAHSYNGLDTRCWNIANNKNYIDKVLSGSNYYEKEQLSLYDCYNEYVLTLLRTSWGINIFELTDKFGEEIANYFVNQSKQFLKIGRLQYANGYYIIPSKFFLISDSIINYLFWA